MEHKGHSVFSSSLSHERVRRDRQTELGEAGRRAWHLRHPTPAQRCPGLYPLGLPVPLKNAGSSSLTERQPLAPLPGHTLVPGPSIFGPPGPESDKKGTAAGHVCPRGTRCSIKGHARFCDLSDGHRDLRTERGRLLLRGCHARSPLPGLGKAAGRLRSACVQTAERLFPGSCSFEGRGGGGGQAKVSHVTADPACSVLNDSHRRGGGTLRREAAFSKTALAQRPLSSRDIAKGSCFERTHSKQKRA